MEQEIIYFWRRMGRIHDRYWYQLNGKSATENYFEQKQKIESQAISLIQKSMKTVINKALDDILKELK